MGKKRKKEKTFIERFNEKQTKGNTTNSMVKGGVDAVASSVLGTGLGAISGKYSAITGIALIIAAHYYGDESGVLRVIGSGALAYGIAKAKDYQENPEYESMQNRVKGLGNDLLTSLHIKWKQQQVQKSETEKKEVSTEDEDISELGRLSNGMDLAAQMVEEQKVANRKKHRETEKQEIDPFDYPETDLTLI